MRVDGEGLGVCGVRERCTVQPATSRREGATQASTTELDAHARWAFSVSKYGCVSARSTVNTAEVTSVANN